jgi:cardiolipin synthase
MIEWLQSLDLHWVALITASSTVLGPLLTAVTIIWVLTTKKNATSAVAWCLLIFFLPLLGPLLFLLFGWQHVHRPLSRKRRHKRLFESIHPSPGMESTPGPTDWPRESDGVQEPATGEVQAGPRDLAGRPSDALPASWEDLARLARRMGAFPVTAGNQVAFYYDGQSAFDAMLEAIRSARHHIHLETFIFQPDGTGRLFLDALTQKARAGVEIRLLYDAMGTRRLTRKLLRSLRAAGGACSVFLPLNLFRRRIQINMRNHRKILVVDGRVAFVGGLNLGDEYLGKVARFGPWRDTHLRLEGPAVASLQRIFIEDWDFAAGEHLQDLPYFPAPVQEGPFQVQVIESGPDREIKGIREMYFAAILRARKRLWIASPYFVPDPGLLDALCLASYLGVDVRLLGLYHPDKWIPFFAARYYWNDVLDAGVKVYQYTKGMMHSKVVLVDGEWGSVGTANLDNRSLYLNFEVNCLIYSPEAVAVLEAAFRHDLHHAIRLDQRVFANRPFAGRLLDNACRLLSPVL